MDGAEAGEGGTRGILRPYVRSHAEPATAPGAKRPRPPLAPLDYRIDYGPL